MTLLAAEGVQKLVDVRRAEQSALDQAQQRAIDVVGRTDQGILEGDLVRALMTELRVTKSVASSATDYLRAIGVVQKDWVTGFLTHTAH
ncbi:hypothetical protein DEJ01_09920 [Curtobacterium sp. MCLR17_040]|uniref:hypothetical protein n=1 Tax=Curtobacterium sp. MCLR17_040 TaxID=2175625 RepID=UPI000DA98BD4|nr:hypothetical protein [Curtobacterium sp. MCLR17_040]PZF02833.1 hypothetical protein DEJ01_09920 [Curtobacterium sp. MCLR17_040]